jgi:hypothetical protein
LETLWSDYELEWLFWLKRLEGDTVVRPVVERSMNWREGAGK